MAPDPLVLLDMTDGVARVTFNRPQRHNSLIPALIAELNATLVEVRQREPDVMVLGGIGRSFSTGGDVAAFHATPRGERRAYARSLVGGLNHAILTLIDLPCPVIARVHGPATGGSLGFLLAADLVAISSSAFIAPYYVEVGFAPDGGWTALLPERIGASRARAIQLLNRHVPADEAVSIGIATEAVAPEQIDSLIDGWIVALRSKQAGGVRATRELLLPPERRAAIAAGLERELERFLDEIESDAVEAGMAKFLAVA